MTQEDWKEVEDRWFNMFDSIEFKCDGFKLALQPEMSKGKLHRMAYVNGRLKGEWLNGESEECRRFYRVKESFVFNKKFRDDMLKLFGKRRYNQEKEKYEEKIKSYLPWWFSFRSFKRHLTANNKDIKLISKQAQN